MNQAQSPWNSLEVTKLVIGVLTPVVIIWLGYLVNRLAQRIQKAQWANQKIIEKRIAIFDEISPILNDLYCYVEFVGNWKELSPKEIIAAKRTLDKRLNIYSPLFSTDLIKLYNKYTGLCFKTYSGPGQDAKMRTPLARGGDDRKKVFPGGWESGWDALFTDESDHLDRSQIKFAYRQLMTQFAKELGIGLEMTRNDRNNE